MFTKIRIAFYESKVIMYDKLALDFLSNGDSVRADQCIVESDLLQVAIRNLKGDVDVSD